MRRQADSEITGARPRADETRGAVPDGRENDSRVAVEDREVWRAALDYLERGWGVFPIAAADRRLSGHCRTLSGKLPTHLRYFIQPITDPRHASPGIFAGCGVGIATGRQSGLLVLDIDGAAGRESARELGLPPTLAVATRHGLHLYYAYPDRRRRVPSSPGGLAAGIDVKGDDGFVAAPPTAHPEGGQYRWVEPRAPIASLPPATLEKIDRLTHRPRWKHYRRYLYRKYLRHPFNALTGR
jgi:hypothetical protein